MQNSNRKSEWVKISVWLVLAGLFVLFFWITCLKNIVSSDEPEDDESGINTFNYSCLHDDTYQEPTLNMGKYYPNGDTSKDYFIIGENNTLKYSGDSEYLCNKLFTFYDETAKQDTIKMWSETRTYTIKTYHEARDQILIEFTIGNDLQHEKYKEAFDSPFKYVDENTFVAVDTYIRVPDDSAAESESYSDDVSVNESKIS